MARAASAVSRRDGSSASASEARGLPGVDRTPTSTRRCQWRPCYSRFFAMNKNFDAVRHAIDVGRELIANFAGAGHDTSPGLVGSARDVPTRKRLQNLLPAGIAVGSGCVIDSYGGTSRQMDVVLYEKQLCPVYRRSKSKLSTPC